jgi:hypothetical protein
MMLLMATVIYCSTEFKWATSVIIDSIRVTAVLTVSTNFSEGQMRDYSVSLYSLKYMKTLADSSTSDVRYVLHACHAYLF